MTKAKINENFSDLEKDILQEIMNIAFGKATADLAEVIDIYVVLSVPHIKIIGMGSLPDYIKNTISAYKEISIVDQKFWGDFNGSGILLFQNNAGRDLITILDDRGYENFGINSLVTLEKEIFLEIGNILIGACVGKLAELLNTFVTYSPPMVFDENSDGYDSFPQSFSPFQTAIIMKTVFKFEQKDIDGLLLIITNQESIGWLKKNLHRFLESYQ